MDRHADFLRLWRSVQGKDADAERALCPLAQEFTAKLDDLLFTPLGSAPTHAQIAQAKYLLQEEWQSWRKSLPERHRWKAPAQHRCIDAVYQASYDRLHLLELTTRPPMRLLLDHYQPPVMAAPAPLPPPPPPPPPQIAGITLGEADEGDEDEDLP